MIYVNRRRDPTLGMGRKASFVTTKLPELDHLAAMITTPAQPAAA